MKTRYVIALFPIVALSACADQSAGYRPVLDGSPNAHFSADLQACQSLARNQRQFDRDTAASAAIGGGIGAVLGKADDAGSAAAGLIVGALATGLSANARK